MESSTPSVASGHGALAVRERVEKASDLYELCKFVDKVRAAEGVVTTDDICGRWDEFSLGSEDAMRLLVKHAINKGWLRLDKIPEGGAQLTLGIRL